jgi:hypothetical protein
MEVTVWTWVSNTIPISVKRYGFLEGTSSGRFTTVVDLRKRVTFCLFVDVSS